VKAVLAVSFERLHRANLVAAGVLPLRFTDASARALFTGAETVEVSGIASLRHPREEVACRLRSPDGQVRTLPLIAGLETRQEVAHFLAGGTYRHLLRERMHNSPATVAY